MRGILPYMVCGAIVTVVGGAFAKSGSHVVTAQMRANALANVDRYEWAADQQQAAIRAAQPYVEMSDEALWRMVPSQWVPRNCGIHNGTGVGCPNCGKEILNVREPQMYMRYAYDRAEHPWKLKCKNCGTLFPSNDYGAFHRSGLDDRGEFDPERADKGLLHNPEHPDPNDPDHMLWVDDGYGLAYSGETLTIIAHYTYSLWRECINATRALAHAWTVTGDPIYAHKAGVLLSRFADIYPNIDYQGFVAANGWGISDGGSKKGHDPRSDLGDADGIEALVGLRRGLRADARG